MGNDMATLKKVKRKRGEAYQICFKNPLTGNTVRKIIWCSQSEAIKIKKQIEADIAFGRFNLDSPIYLTYTWKQLKKKFTLYSIRNKSEKTVKRQKNVFDAFEKFLKGNPPLSEITRDTIERFKEKRLSMIREATVSIELRILKATFNQGINWEMMDKNPVRGIKLPGNDIIKVWFLRQDEITSLLKVIDNFDFKRLVIAYLHTGARRNELLKPKFTWDNVNFHERRILLDGKGKRKRYIPLNDTLIKVFTEIKVEGSEVPFTFKPDYVTHKIKDYYSKSKIQGANLHSLRKTFGSLLLQNGIADLFTVSKLLGHSSVSTTEKYYVDLLDKNYRDSVKGLDHVIGS